MKYILIEGYTIIRCDEIVKINATDESIDFYNSLDTDAKPIDSIPCVNREQAMKEIELIFKFLGTYEVLYRLF